jgi:DNA primase
VLFDKGRTLYGLSFGRKAIRETNTAVIVEGYMDVIAAHQAGFANVVSPMGVALTEAQMRRLMRYARRMVLALDADTAGDQATLRGLAVAREALDRDYQAAFDPRGLIRLEGRMRADIRAVTLPAGKDPDEVILGSPGVWRDLIEKAQPVVDYVMRALAAGRDLDDPKVKVEIAEEVLPLIADVADPVERSDYVQRLARFLKVDPRALMQKRPAARRPRPGGGGTRPQPAEPVAAPAVQLSPASRLEAYCLRVLVRAPELMYKADRHLQALGLERLSEEDFSDAGHRAIFAAVKASLAQDTAEPADFVRESLDEALVPVLDALLADEPGRPADPAADPAGEALRAITRLRRRAVDGALTRLRFLVEDVQSEDDSAAAPMLQTIARLAGARQKLDRALASAV